MKKFITLMLVLSLVVINVSNAQAVYITDEMILAEPIENEYIGRPEAAAIIRNLNFTDLPENHWAKESIVKSGALGIIKGYDSTFRPNDVVTNEEALSFIVNLIGQEANAQEAAITAYSELPPNSPLRNLWSIGVLSLSVDIGLITDYDYYTAVTEFTEEDEVPVGDIFIRTDPATREDVANWIYLAMNKINPMLFTTNQTQQSIYSFSDFDNIAVDKVVAVEALVRNNVINSTGEFRPKDRITRAELAVILANLDSLYNRIWGLTKTTGTIGAIIDAQYTTTASDIYGTRFYIRTENGTVDVIRYTDNITTSPQSEEMDVVVFKDGNVTGLNSLEGGDMVEYIVNPTRGQAYYLRVLNSGITARNVQGKLVNVNTANDTETEDFIIEDAEINNTITITDDTNKTFTYSMINSAIITSVSGIKSLMIDGKPIPLNELPFGSTLELELENNIVRKINFVGLPQLYSEIRGIVLENNINMGYLVIIDNDANIVTKYYNEGNIKVEKQQYYDVDDEVGYFDEVFPNFEYDPRDTGIYDIEPGDIVFLRPGTGDYIESISASTNYMMRYGKIKSIITNGSISTILMEYENKQTSWFDIAHSIFISKDGVPVSFSDIKVGDWAKILVNQAIVERGHVIESVKEVTLEGDEHFISTILKGKLSTINTIQNQIILQNVYELGHSDWGNYQDLRQLSIAGRDIEYYHNNKRVSLDYVNQFLKRTTGDVYVALENNYSDELVKKITFRDGQDILLNPDTVVSADGNGKFAMVSVAGQIYTDQGTIVRRFGRLVDGKDVLIPDYALVALNGANQAAVIDIDSAPDVSEVTIIRGRIMRVDEGNSFTVRSMSMFTGNGWSYTPIPREFTIDHNTLFLNADGYFERDTFADYGDDSIYDKVYNIVANGTHADLVADSPYTQEFVRGTVYAVEENTVSIKDVTYYNRDNFQWRALSTSNSSATVNIHPNTIIAKQNKTILPTELEVGDQIKVALEVLPALTGGMTIDAYIVIAER